MPTHSPQHISSGKDPFHGVPSLLVSTPHLQAVFPFEALYPTLKAHSLQLSLPRTVIFHQQYPAPVSTLPSACSASFLPLETPSLLSRGLALFSHAPATLPEDPPLGTTLPISNFFSPPSLRLVRRLPGSNPSPITSNVSHPHSPFPLAPGLQCPPRSRPPMHPGAHNDRSVPPFPAFDLPQSREPAPSPDHCTAAVGGCQYPKEPPVSARGPTLLPSPA